MLKLCLRRYGLWPVVLAVTAVSVVLSLGISTVVHWAARGTPPDALSLLLSVGVPLVLAPAMSRGMLALVLQLDRAHQQLRAASDLDDLTGAFNRRCFMERLNEEAGRAARGGPAFSVALIDVDDFKAINDRHGHLAGDEVLRALARVCQAQVRSTDTFARYGGEEFAVLLPQTHLPQARLWLERLREKVSQLVVSLPDAQVRVTVSAGVACPALATPHRAAHVLAALRAADEALYRAKRDGKNRVHPPAAPAPPSVLPA